MYYINEKIKTIFFNFYKFYKIFIYIIKSIIKYCYINIIYYIEVTTVTMKFYRL